MQVDKVLLTLVAYATVSLARNVRCPPQIETNSVFANKLSSSKYFVCSSLRLLDEYECKDGELFDPAILRCHKPISGRCACPETTPCPTTTTTECPCPTNPPCPTDPPCPTTTTTTTTTSTTTQCPSTTPCPCRTNPPCPQTLGQQNIQPFSMPCENCIPGKVHTPSPVFMITAPPALNYNQFGVPDIFQGAIIVTDGPPPPC